MGGSSKVLNIRIVGGAEVWKIVGMSSGGNVEIVSSRVGVSAFSN